MCLPAAVDTWLKNMWHVVDTFVAEIEKELIPGGFCMSGFGQVGMSFITMPIFMLDFLWRWTMGLLDLGGWAYSERGSPYYFNDVVSFAIPAHPVSIFLAMFDKVLYKLCAIIVELIHGIGELLYFLFIGNLGIEKLAFMKNGSKNMKQKKSHINNHEKIRASPKNCIIFFTEKQNKEVKHNGIIFSISQSKDWTCAVQPVLKS
ncbi:hypothetical protein ACJX0J_030665, partial [Zea mays]